MASPRKKSELTYTRCIFFIEYVEGDPDIGEVALPDGKPFTLEEMEAFLAEEAERPVVHVLCLPKDENDG